MGYYEIMKNTFDRQLPPPKKLGIKSIRIHSIAGNSQKTGRFSKPLLCSNAPMSFSAVTEGVGKGDGSDLKVKIISKKELIFQCVCAKQENCTVSLYHTHTHTIFSSVERMFDSFPPALKGLPRRGQQCGSDQPAERACG